MHCIQDLVGIFFLFSFLGLFTKFKNQSTRCKGFEEGLGTADWEITNHANEAEFEDGLILAIIVGNTI